MGFVRLTLQINIIHLLPDLSINYVVIITEEELYPLIQVGKFQRHILIQNFQSCVLDCCVVQCNCVVQSSSTMKSTPVLVLFTLIASACTWVLPDLTGYFEINSVPNSTLVEAEPITDTLIPTLTSVLQTPTFTLTPTLEGRRSVTVTPVLPPITVTQTLVWSPTPLPVGDGFDSVEVSGNRIFWGVCKPGEVKVTARVTHPKDVYNVIFFVHLEDTTSDNSTPWSTGDAMNNNHRGKFTYTLNADVIDEHRHYRRAWVVYQLVATAPGGRILGRTPVFERTLTIEPCP